MPGSSDRDQLYAASAEDLEAAGVAHFVTFGDSLTVVFRDGHSEEWIAAAPVLAGTPGERLSFAGRLYVACQPGQH